MRSIIKRTPDERQEWYRYHQLFHDLLSRQLEAQLAPDGIAGLHRLAATWFETQGLRTLKSVRS